MLETANERLYSFWGSLTEGLRTGLPQNEMKSGGQGLFESVYGDPQRLRLFLGAPLGEVQDLQWAAQAWTFTETLVAVGVVEASGIATASCGAGSFGGILEWYVARELRRWLGFDVATGSTAPGLRRVRALARGSAPVGRGRFFDGKPKSCYCGRCGAGRCRSRISGMGSRCFRRCQRAGVCAVG
jgi:hypothetical protein